MVMKNFQISSFYLNNFFSKSIFHCNVLLFSLHFVKTLLNKALIFSIIFIFSFSSFAQTSKKDLYGTWNFQYSEEKQVNFSISEFNAKEKITAHINNYYQSPIDSKITYTTNFQGNIDRDYELKKLQNNIWTSGEITWMKDFMANAQSGTFTPTTSGESFRIFKVVNNGQIYGRLYSISYYVGAPMSCIYRDFKADRINSETSSTGDDDEFPWEVVIIGAAIGAAVVAIRKKLKKGKTQNNKKENKEEKEKAGYILQLSTEKFDFSEEKQGNLEVRVVKVTETSQKSINAAIQIVNSEPALQIQPTSGTTPFNCQLLLKAQPKENQFKITVVANAEGHKYQRDVEISIGGEKEIIVELVPNKRTLRPNLNRLITCYTKVVDEMGDPMQELTQEIEFIQTSDWVNCSETIMDEDWKVINIDVYDPDGNAVVSHPPESVTLSWVMEKVPENEPILQKDIEIQLLDCKIDVNVDTHELSFVASEEETSLTFEAYIENCDGSEPWNFSGEYKTEDNREDEALTTISHKKITDYKAEFTISGPLLQPKENQQYLQKKLVISGFQKDEEPLERHLYVYVVKEGLYINKGLNEDGQLKFLAKGDVEKDLEFSLYCYNKNTKQLEVNKEALKDLNFELLDTSLVAQNIDTVLQTEFVFDNFVTTIPRARYIYKAPLKFPGFGDFHELNYLVSANVNTAETDNPEAFQKNIKLLVQTYGIGNKFPAWQEAYKNCKTAIYLVPESDKRQKLLQILEKNKNKMDIEGMVLYRKKVWSIAHDLMINERDGYMSIANWHTAIIDSLEWVVWCGDLAFQVVVSAYLGPFAGFSASAFKDIALTGYTMAIEGKSVDEYIDAQLESFKQMIYSAAKGRVINTETIEKFYKGNKIKVWAIYAVATFAAAYLDVKSIPEAAKITARQLRDEAIIRFLNGKVQEEKARLASNNKNSNKEPKKQKEQDDKQKNLGKKSSKGKDDYERTNTPPDVSGYTEGSVKMLQKIADKYGVKIFTRPTNKHAKKLLESGKAVPKKSFVKNKTINEFDTYLGASEGDIGKVGSFKPKLKAKVLKKLPQKLQDKIIERYKQRKAEYTDQAYHLEQNLDKLYVKKGVVYDKLSGKPYTGDVDIFDIRGSNGEKLPKSKINNIIKELRKSHLESGVEHGAHVEWDWKDIKDPFERQKAKEMYEKIMSNHTKGGEALVEFSGDSSPNAKPKSAYYKGKKNVIILN